MKTCERCSNTAVRGERYCKYCRGKVLAELRDAGYLASRPVGHIGRRRTAEERESTNETRYGRDG
jgi:hypothetical protein